MRIGMLTGGGDCPGLNAVLRAAVRKGQTHYNDELFGFRDGQALQQDFVSERKDRGVRADAQRERKHDHAREARILCEHAQCVTNIR